MQILQPIKKRPVLTVSVIVAVASMLFVPPNWGYIAYIDVDVIILLFCLMASVHGLQRNGFFDGVAVRLLRACSNSRICLWVLLLLIFFGAMFITNDVSLIVFVPLSILVLRLMGLEDKAPFVVSLEAVAANLGSMLLPFGNPQNLFLYEAYDAPIGDFLMTLLPFSALSLAAVIACAFIMPSKGISTNSLAEPEPVPPRISVGFIAVFALSVLSVLRIVPSVISLAAVVIASLILDRRTLREVDYGLLVTFVCFFIFAGNMSQITAVQDAVGTWMQDAPFYAALGVSQVISNVPAAVLLEPFTANWQQLLLGVDIGGLGTPIASLASLIAWSLYRRAGYKSGRFFAWFFSLNIAFLAILVGVHFVL